MTAIQQDQTKDPDTLSGQRPGELLHFDLAHGSHEVRSFRYPYLEFGSSCASELGSSHTPRLMRTGLVRKVDYFLLRAEDLM